MLLVTYSLGAIEGRKAVVRDAGKRVAGWISVVGMVDLQSSLRAISGGVDYGYGLLQGVRFGRHELVGVVADMDHTGLDAIEHKLGFLEESRRDFAVIAVPVNATALMLLSYQSRFLPRFFPVFRNESQTGCKPQFCGPRAGSFTGERCHRD